MQFKHIKTAAAVCFFLLAGVFYCAVQGSRDVSEDFGTAETVVSEDSEALGAKETEVSVEKAENTDASVEKAEDMDASSASAEPGQIHVHVCGAVKQAGVYLLNEHSIIEDAVKAAGGVLEDGAADYLNLAGSIHEGDKIYVPFLKDLDNPYGILPESDSSSGNGEREPDSSDGLVNLNTADRNQLMTLTGIGESRADAILAYRSEHGSFQKIEDIMKVSGIKEGAFNKIKDQIKV